MSIGDLASGAGLTVKTLRFYEQAGVLAVAARLPSGYRDYDGAALARLRFVKAAGRRPDPDQDQTGHRRPS